MTAARRPESLAIVTRGPLQIPAGMDSAHYIRMDSRAFMLIPYFILRPQISSIGVVLTLGGLVTMQTEALMPL